MKLRTNQSGFGHLVLVVILLVVAAAGFVGWRIMQQADTDTAITAGAKGSAVIPAQINSKADVKKADKALDNTSIDSSVNPAQLDSDLNALL